MSVNTDALLVVASRGARVLVDSQNHTSVVEYLGTLR